MLRGACAALKVCNCRQVEPSMWPDPLRGACVALKVCNCRQLEPSMWPDPLRGARPVQTICVLIKSLLAGAPELASPDWGPKGSLSD